MVQWLRLCSQPREAPVHFLDSTHLGNFPGGPVAKTLLPTQGGPGSLPRSHTPQLKILPCMLSPSVMSLFATTWSVACQAPLSMGFSRREYWSGLPFPPPGELPNPGVESVFPMSPAIGMQALHHSRPLGSPKQYVTSLIYHFKTCSHYISGMIQKRSFPHKV